MSDAPDKSLPHAVDGVVERNISALLERRRLDERELGWQDRLAAAVTGFAGSMAFVWLHAAMFGLWIAVNAGAIPAVPRFDPSLVLLAMTASVEAIFLSTFILITQNRLMSEADRRADLNLQISLLAEHEITRLVRMVGEIAHALDLPSARSREIASLAQDVPTEGLLDKLDRQQQTEAAMKHGASEPTRSSTDAPT